MPKISAPTASPPSKPSRNSFPAWRLREGTINASDAQLELAEASCARWEWGCVILVLVAVIAEVVLAIVHPSYDSPWNRWGTAVADAAIALGIVGELAFGRLDARIQTELRRRSNNELKAAVEAAAKAHERAGNAERTAAEAQLELAKYRASRRDVFRGHEAAIRDKLATYSGTPFDTGLPANDGEAADFLWDLEPTLVAAGWVHVAWFQLAGDRVWQGPHRPASGAVAAQNVEIHLHPANRGALLPAATALIGALNEIGIAATDAGFNTLSINNHAIHILIGPKR